MNTWDRGTDPTYSHGPDYLPVPSRPAIPEPTPAPQPTPSTHFRQRLTIVLLAAFVLVAGGVVMAKFSSPSFGQSGEAAINRAQQAAMDISGCVPSTGPTPTQSATPGPGPSTTPGSPTPSGSTTVPPADPNSPKPNAANTGPRYSTTRTITAAAAMTELRATKKLSRVKITGGLTFNGSDGRGWVISDSVIESRGSTYAVKAYVDSGFTGTRAERPVLQNVEVRGAAVTGSGHASALFYGSDTIWRKSKLYGGVDIFKLVDRVVLEDSYAYGLDHPDGAHADVIQIRQGRDSVIQRNTFAAIVGYGTNVGQSGNAVLQTGSMTGPLTNVQFLNNWVNGGNYILNVGDPGLGYLFSGNKFGRTYRYIPVMGSTAGKTNGTNVWEDNGQKVF